MITSVLSTVAVVAALLPLATAHMRMEFPVPYGQATLSSAPLDSSGADFPCKLRPGVYDVTKMNFIEVGVLQPLSFIGGATHGGGSCQVSVCLDQEPTKDSRWKVVHSIIGGCPVATPANDNLSDNPDDRGSDKFQFKLPPGMPNGRYTMAWSWINKLGFREFYMNCAPITVSGGADEGDTTVFDSLPDMFVANLPPDECSTVHGEDFAYPDPGNSVQIHPAATSSSGPQGRCQSRFATGAGIAAPVLPPKVFSPPPAVTDGSNAVPTPTLAPVPFPQNPGGIFAPIPLPVSSSPVVDGSGEPEADSGNQSDLAVVPTPAPVPIPAPVSAAPPVSLDTASGNETDVFGECRNGRIRCSSPGGVVCLNGKRFGLCNIDGCATPQDLALGAPCPGEGAETAHVTLPPHGRAHRRRHVLSVL